MPRSFGQEYEERITQEEFAVELVKSMKLEGSLPLAALASDCIDLLQRLGVSPLEGWQPKNYLTKEDYLVLLGKAHGKEDKVHELGEMVELENVRVINEKWQESYQQLGRWLTIEELLNSDTYFPDGPPKSPYGNTYQDEDGDHKVDETYLPAVGLMKLRKRITSYGRMP